MNSTYFGNNPHINEQKSAVGPDEFYKRLVGDNNIENGSIRTFKFDECLKIEGCSSKNKITFIQEPIVPVLKENGKMSLFVEELKSKMLECEQVKEVITFLQDGIENVYVVVGQYKTKSVYQLTGEYLNIRDKYKQQKVEFLIVSRNYKEEYDIPSDAYVIRR